MKVFIYLILLPVLFSGCSGCSKSGRMGRNSKNAAIPVAPLHDTTNNRTSATVVKMKKINGVYQIPVEVDDIPMSFIFDTGAGIISISEVEALFLYRQGKLTNDDVIGSENFADANGDISEGTIINLRTVKIGTRTLRNVQASVVHNLGAPLLFGQSALEQFGKISIDYRKEEITFE
jgi:aspartyl protease family protein